MLGCHSLCISQLLTLRTLPVQSVMQALYINEHSVLVIIHIASMLVTIHIASMFVNCFLFFLFSLFSQKGPVLVK